MKELSYFECYSISGANELGVLSAMALLSACTITVGLEGILICGATGALIGSGWLFSDQTSKVACGNNTTLF